MSTFDDFKRDFKKRDPERFLALEITSKIISTRHRMRISQAELSRLSGVSQKTISEIESGKVLPQFSTLVKLAEPLNLGLVMVDKTEYEQQEPLKLF